MRLTIHRGTHEIGGNCVELCTDNTRLVIDVGMPLVDADRNPFDGKAMRRKSKEQLIADGTLPKVPGLFDDRPAPGGILLSHAHADHTGLLEYTNPEIPVYLSQGTSKMMLAGSIFAGQPSVDRKRSVVFEPEQPFQVGDFRIAAYPVDHSAFDSMAFVVEADGKRLLYSGDLRLHGRKPGMAKRLIEAATRAPIDVLLLEGTHFTAGRERGVTERELEEQIVNHVTEAADIVLAAFSPMHVDRLVTFYRAAKRTGRTFIVDPYAAFVMHLVSGQAKIPRPSEAADIRVYFNKYFEESHEWRRLKKIHGMFQADQITLDQILDEPKRYLMVFRPSMVSRDFEGHLPRNARCLYSYWKGYLGRPDWKDLRESLASADGDFAEAHTSGHIFADDIIQFVRAINPRMVVPIHTFESERFYAFFEGVQLVTDGVMIEIE
jgi:ribonuclease J